MIHTLSGTAGAVVQPKNRLHPYDWVCIGTDGSFFADHRQAKALQDLARNACQGRSQPVLAAFEPFNKAIDEGRNMRT